MTRQWTRIHRIVVPVALLSFLPLQQSPAAADVSGSVAGIVISHAAKRPVSGATVALPEFGATATSGRDGSFAFAEPLPADVPYRRIEAVVTAPGYGRWTIRGVPLYPGDTLKLRAELRAGDWEHQVRTPAERGTLSRTLGPNILQGNTCTAWDFKNVPPPTIKVWRSEEGVSEKYDFMFYARHVLPNEWIASWDEDALGAGAVAVKTYAAYRAMSDHAYRGGSECADVIDTVADQVFDPTWSHENTDQATYAAMGSILHQNGRLFLSHYWSGARDDPCEYADEGQFAGWMVQWGTETCSDEGKYWPDIVTIFYHDTDWKYLENLLLDSSAESEGDYAWSWDGTATRVKGESYHKSWHWLHEPPQGRIGSIWETRPFLGTETTRHHAEAAIMCPKANPTDCTVTLRLRVFEPDGSSHKQNKTFTVPDDGVWRLYTFDPAASGFVHEEVRLSVRSEQTVGVDAAVLWSSYGSD